MDEKKMHHGDKNFKKRELKKHVHIAVEKSFSSDTNPC